MKEERDWNRAYSRSNRDGMNQLQAQRYNHYAIGSSSFNSGAMYPAGEPPGVFNRDRYSPGDWRPSERDYRREYERDYDRRHPPSS